ncbi:MAG TPA: 4a-hydroxytetrahydrobiopterin dehydratase [Candidatus Limnocylindria bacterium]|nr:4a-hydroxytetrahydrobiopterin dehydratase [Candidatus Limnocylindria bacterium]
MREDERRIDDERLATALAGLEGWERLGETIVKTYRRKGWKDAIAFVNAVAEAATVADHHPDIHVERYRNVRIVLTTHDASGISLADIDLARRIDALAT